MADDLRARRLLNYKLVEGSRFQTVNGENHSKTIVFLHGWGGSVTGFLFVAKRLATYGYRCLLVDFAGFGETPEPNMPYTVRDYSEDLRALLCELSISSAVLVGHSFGGRVAIELAVSHPSLVDKLVLVDSAGCKPRRHIDYYFKIFTHKLLRKIGCKGLKGSKDYRVLSPVMRQTFKNVVGYYQDDKLPLISCKTAIFWGKNDNETPAYMAKRLNRYIKNSDLFWLEGGHFAYMDDFFRFFSVLLAFLKE